MFLKLDYPETNFGINVKKTVVYNCTPIYELSPFFCTDVQKDMYLECRKPGIVDRGRVWETEVISCGGKRDN